VTGEFVRIWGEDGGDFIFMYFAALADRTKENHDKPQVDLSITVKI
jgi:hypothetical protein